MPRGIYIRTKENSPLGNTYEEIYGIEKARYLRGIRKIKFRSKISYCIFCDKEFFVPPSRKKDNRGKYCCKKCYINSMIGTHRTEKTKKKISKNCWQRKMKGNYSIEIRKKMSKWQKGKTYEELNGIEKAIERKRKFVETRRKNDSFHAWNKNIPFSKEVKKKMSENNWMKKNKGHLSKAIKKQLMLNCMKFEDTSIEIIIHNFLNELKIEFFKQFYIGSIEHNYFCDIFIPSMNLIIECDGDYWHGNINHKRYKILNDHQLKQVYEDKIRNKELIESGYNILRLWECEIRKMDLKQFKRILEDNYGISTQLLSVTKSLSTL